MCLVLAWVLVLVWFVSNPGIDYLEALAALAGTIVVVAALLVAGARGLISRRGSLLLCSALVLLLVAAVTIFGRAQSPSNPLFRLRFALSQPALAERAALHTTNAPTRDPEWVGLFYVVRIERLGNEVRFITGMCGVVDQCGLVYRSAPPARVSGKERLRRLAENWYHVYVVF